MDGNPIFFSLRDHPVGKQPTPRSHHPGSIRFAQFMFQCDRKLRMQPTRTLEHRIRHRAKTILLTLTKETASANDKNPTPQRSPLGVFLAFALVASVLLLVRELHVRFQELLEKELSSPRKIGNVILLPEGHQSSGLFQHTWKRIRIAMPGLQIRLVQPSLQINLFNHLSREMLFVSIDSLDGRLTPRLLAHTEKQAIENYSHPDFWLPFRAALKLGHLRFAVENIGQWQASSLYLGSHQQKSVGLVLQSVQGSHLPDSLDIRVRYQWSRRFSDATLRISNPYGDSIWIAANAPRKHLEDLSADLAIAVQDLPKWLPMAWPAQAPRTGPITMNGTLQANLRHKTLLYSAELNTRLSRFWQIPAMDCQLKASGNEKMQIDAEVLFDNARGQSIKAQAHLDKNLNGNAQAEVHGISLTLGPQTLPADLVVHRLIKHGDSLHATITTQAGSEVIGTLKGFKSPRIDFTANIAPAEPWAVQWTRGNLQLAPPTLIEGRFQRGILSANVRTKVPYAYKVMADMFETDLTLSYRGIQFDNGTIATRGHIHSFTGEVIWNDSIPHFAFSLEQDQDRFAQVYGTFTADLDLKVAGIELQALPFADSTFLRGYGGSVTGIWHHAFSSSTGQAQATIVTEVKGIPLRLSAEARQAKDSLILSRIVLRQGNNQLEGDLLALLRKDSTEADSPAVRLAHAQLATTGLNLPEIAQAFRDSTMQSGNVSGKLQYDRASGLQGGLVFSDLALRSVDTTQFSISRLRLSTQKQRILLSGRLKVGQGLWDGEAEITLDSAFTPGPHRLSGAYATDNGGILWFEGYVDSLRRQWDGKLHLNGPWFLPPGTGEIRETDFSADLHIPFRKDLLTTMTANFHSRQTQYSLGTLLSMPVEFKGFLDRGLLTVSQAQLSNENGEKLTARIQFDIPDKRLEELSFQSEQFTLPLQGMHHIRLYQLSGRTEKSEQEISVLLDLPKITYTLSDKTLGEARAALHGQIRYRIPTKAAGTMTQANSTVEGDILIDKAVYRKQLDIAPDPLHLDRTFAAITNMLTKMRKEKPPAEAKALSGRPTTLNVRINDTSKDSLMVISNLATFPFAVDLAILGTTQNPLLTGDINSIGNGFIGFEGFATFELSALRLSWQDVPWRRGQIEIQSSHDFPYCEEDNSEETCPIELNISGSITNPQPLPTANCGVESSPALIYYSILLGCVSQNQQTDGFDKNKVTGRLLGNLLASTANKGLGGDYIGDVDLKMRIFDNSSTQERDSSYVRIPVSLERWVHNLSAVLAYTQDQSINPRYDQAIEGGLQYDLPIFDSTETSMNLINPRLEASANLVARRYQSTVETEAEDSRLEMNIGLLYTYKFWDPCILGIGQCGQLEKKRPTPLKEKP